MVNGTAQRTGGVIDVEATEAREMLERGLAVLIDVRETDEYIGERIHGAMLHPLSRFDAAAVQRFAAEHPGKTPVLHCQGGVRSADAGRRLLAAGWGEIRHIRGGLKAWKAAGLPTESGPPTPVVPAASPAANAPPRANAATGEAGATAPAARRVPISIMRQVQITAGSLIVAGVALALAVHPLWALLSGGIGAGLVFAGATNTCGMAMVLARMPWNRVFKSTGATCSV